MYLRINLRIFIFIIIFFITKQIEFYAMLMLFAFLHELGHLACGVLLGFRLKSLTINPMGLAINFKINTEDYNKSIKNGKKKKKKKIIIALCGPLVNFIIALLFAKFNFSLFNFSRENIIYANILIALFNLIPIYPLDGGRIIKNALHILIGLEPANTKTNNISGISVIVITVIASFGILYLKNIAILFIVIYLWYLVIQENKMMSQRNRIMRILKNKKIKSLKT